MMEETGSLAVLLEDDYNSETSSDNDPDSEQEGQTSSAIRVPKPKKKRKYSGAATYQTKFNPDWRKEFSFISAVSSDPYRYETLTVIVLTQAWLLL